MLSNVPINPQKECSKLEYKFLVVQSFKNEKSLQKEKEKKEHDDLIVQGSRSRVSALAVVSICIKELIIFFPKYFIPFGR